MTTHTRPHRLRSKLFGRPLLVAVLPAVMLIASACSSNSSSSSPPQAGAAGEWQQADQDLANPGNSAHVSSRTSVNWRRLDLRDQGASASDRLLQPARRERDRVPAGPQEQRLRDRLSLREARVAEAIQRRQVGPNGAGYDDGKLFVTNGRRPSWLSMRRVAKRFGPSGSSRCHPGDHATAHGRRRHPLREHRPGSSVSHFYEGGGSGSSTPWTADRQGAVVVQHRQERGAWGTRR